MQEFHEKLVAAAGLNIVSILGRAWSTLWRKPAVFLGLGLLVQLPYVLPDVFAPDAFAPDDFTPDDASPYNPIVQFSAAMSSLILSMLVQGAIVYAVYQSLTGRPVTFAESFSRGLARLGGLILTAILAGLGIAFGCLLLLIPGIILMCAWEVALPACIVEKLGPRDSLRRSAELTRGYRWTIFALLLIVFGLTLVIAIAVNVLLLLFTSGGTFIISLAVALALVVPQAFACIMTPVIYYDLRTAREGISLDNLAKVFD